MLEYLVFIATAIGSLFYALYFIFRVSPLRISAVYQKSKLSKFLFLVKLYGIGFLFWIFIFSLLSGIPLICYAMKVLPLKIIVDCVYIGASLLLFIISLFYLVYPEFNFKQIKIEGIEPYYMQNKEEFEDSGITSLSEKEKFYIEYKLLKWKKADKNIFTKFIKDDPHSFIYFVLSTIIAIICLFF